jgi:hypothetical protein
MSTGTNTPRACFAGSLPLSKDSPPLKKQTVAVTARHSETASCPRIGPKSMVLSCEKLLKTRSKKPCGQCGPYSDRLLAPEQASPETSALRGRDSF